MVAKDDFDFFCEDNNIRMLTSLVGVENKHIWTLKYPNNEEVTYEIIKIGNVDELYTFREKLHKEAQIKMRNIKLWKLTQEMK